MVEEAEAEGRRVEVVPLHVDLLDRVVDVIGEFRVEFPLSTALVLVGGNVCSVRHERAQAVSRDDLRG